MLKHVRIVVLLAALSSLLSACAGGAFGGFAAETEAVTETTVTQVVRSYDQGEAGDLYVFTVTVPDSWVDTFEVDNNGSSVVFHYIGENNRRAQILTIDALSLSQFWEQNGSYPGSYNNIAATPDTYFVYHSPIDAYYSGLPQAQFDELRAAIPDIIASFSAVEADDNMSVMSTTTE